MSDVTDSQGWSLSRLTKRAGAVVKQAARDVHRATMTHVVIDPIPDPVQVSYAAVFGWMRSPRAPSSVEVTLGGVPIYSERHPRSDLQALFPGIYSTGIYAVIDLAVHREAIERADRRLDVALTIDGATQYTQSVSVTPEALVRAAAGPAAKARKREFVAAHAACPRCGASLPLPASAASFRCAGCGANFPQQTSALNFVPDATDVPKLLATSLFSYSPHEREVIDRVSAAGGMVLDFGAGLRESIEPAVVNLEIADYPTTDVISAGERLPFLDATFDAVVSLHVLEHVRRPWIAAQEIQRVLKPGGTAICTVPFVCAEHGFPDHFFNMTRSGLPSLFEGMTLEQHFIKGDGAAINGIQQLLSVFYGNLPEPHRTTFAEMKVGEIVNTPLADLVARDFSVHLPEEARWKLAAHTTVVLRKT